VPSDRFSYRQGHFITVVNSHNPWLVEPQGISLIFTRQLWPALPSAVKMSLRFSSQVCKVKDNNCQISRHPILTNNLSSHKCSYAFFAKFKALPLRYIILVAIDHKVNLSLIPFITAANKLKGLGFNVGFPGSPYNYH